jgi:hypothetical protein
MALLNGEPLGKKTTAGILILVTAGMFLLAWFLPGPGRPRGLAYVAVMALMLVFVATLGARKFGRLDGILINERNLISLTRFQTVLWTVIILSAFLTDAVARISFHIPNALDISLDKTLWALLGISTTSLVGTPLIQSTKKVQEPDPKEVQKAETALGETDIKEKSQGVLYANKNVSDAAFTDMFEGDEVGNTAYIDVAKVQMFFFTIVAALSYGIDLTNWITGINQATAQYAVAFPVVSGGLVAILGISHAGFLAGKSVTHTPTKQNSAGSQSRAPLGSPPFSSP